MNRCGAERFTVETNEIGGCVRGADHRGVHRDAHWNEWGEPETVPQANNEPGESPWT